MLMKSVRETDFGEYPLRRGKVRDVYDLGTRLLIVATDRISAFDYVLPTPIPGKGRILTALSKFWFDMTASTVPNHYLSDRIEDLPDDLHTYRGVLEDRFMLVAKAEVLPIECVVRGYVAGSAWADYVKTGSTCGVRLPSDMVESQELNELIFTPATKASSGHDMNVSFDDVVARIGRDSAEFIRDKSLAVYELAREHARRCGIILCDTKFEWGASDDRIILIDEVLTPDSSRFWPLELYEPGGPQPSFDKQFVRDFLSQSGWDKNSPPPPLPEEVVRKTLDKYVEAYRRLTGRTIQV